MADGRIKQGIFKDNKFFDKKTVKLPPPIMEDAETDENIDYAPV